ncbi:uncharacterized protein [Hyperolius riggenbachi]|uniref:uncharacterized protein n=1 Tax=Hyperolius riggenbachi TaxID=752182 RepID=UPI0035A279D5
MTTSLRMEEYQGHMTTSLRMEEDQGHMTTSLRMEEDQSHMITSLRMEEDQGHVITSLRMEEDQSHMTTSLRMEEDHSHMTERIFNLTLEIICLLTGESFPPVKYGDHMTIAVPPLHSLISEGHKQKIPEVTRKMIELLTGEIPIRYQDFNIYFSMEEWQYIEGHQDLYMDAVMESQPPLTSPDVSSNRNPPERCTGPLYSWDWPQEDPTIPQHDQAAASLMDHMTTSLRMEEDQSHMTERIFNLTREIICLLTGERFPPVKSGDHVTIVVSPSHSLIFEKDNKQKILEITRKMIELLTGEHGVPASETSQRLISLYPQTVQWMMRSLDKSLLQISW